MAGSEGKTGQGIAIVFGSSGFVATLHFVGGTERTRPAIETSHLGLVAGSERTYIPHDLIEGGEFVLRYEWEQSFSTFPPLTDAAETITITFPKLSGEATAATLAGTGFCIRDKSADAEVNQSGVMVGELTIKWDGATGPAFTAGSA